MSITHPGDGRAVRPRPAATTRRVGYLAAAVADTALLVAANLAPGWDAVPFLTAETSEVMPEVNASLAVGLVVSLVLLVHDPAWWKALGDVITTVVGIVAIIEVWQVFPIDVDGDPWETVARWVLGVGLVGSFIGLLTAFGALVRAVGGQPLPLSRH